MHNRVRIAKKLETFAVRERSPFIRFSNFRTIQFERGVRDASIREFVAVIDRSACRILKTVAM